ncbi:MAG: hypothetical protein ACLQRH_08970 [Acidimicrobiales bacterium]
MNARDELEVAGVDAAGGGVVAAAVAGGAVVEVEVVGVAGTAVVVVEVELVVVVLAGRVVDVVVEELDVPQASAASAAVPATTTPMVDRRATAQRNRTLRKCRPISVLSTTAAASGQPQQQPLVNHRSSVWLHAK